MLNNSFVSNNRDIWMHMYQHFCLHIHPNRPCSLATRPPPPRRQSRAQERRFCCPIRNTEPSWARVRCERDRCAPTTCLASARVRVRARWSRNKFLKVVSTEPATRTTHTRGGLCLCAVRFVEPHKSAHINIMITITHWPNFERRFACGVDQQCKWAYTHPQYKYLCW